MVGGAGTRRFVDLPASDDGMRGVCVYEGEEEGERDGGGRKVSGSKRIHVKDSHANENVLNHDCITINTLVLYCTFVLQDTIGKNWRKST